MPVHLREARVTVPVPSVADAKEVLPIFVSFFPSVARQLTLAYFASHCLCNVATPSHPYELLIRLQTPRQSTNKCDKEQINEYTASLDRSRKSKNTRGLLSKSLIEVDG